MLPNSRSLKEPAWRAMRAAVPSAILVTLTYLLLTSGLVNAVSLLTPTFTVGDLVYDHGADVWTGLFLAVLLTIYQVVMEFGYTSWTLRTARGEQAGYGHLLDGFGMAGRVLLMQLQIFLCAMGWVLGLSIGYALLIVFMASALAISFPGASIFLTVVLTLAFYAGVVAILLRYELAPFLLCDHPDRGSRAAVRDSVYMVSGKLWPLVKLYLSFWPWYLAQFAISFVPTLLLVLTNAAQWTPLAQSGDFAMMLSQLQTMLSSPGPTLLLMAVSLPLNLFFLPYQRMAVANFYRSLSGEPVVPSFSGETF